jgi:hypothetical protein
MICIGRDKLHSFIQGKRELVARKPSIRTGPITQERLVVIVAANGSSVNGIAEKARTIQSERSPNDDIASNDDRSGAVYGMISDEPSDIDEIDAQWMIRPIAV